MGISSSSARATPRPTRSRRRVRQSPGPGRALLGRGPVRHPHAPTRTTTPSTRTTRAEHYSWSSTPPAASPTFADYW